MTASPRVRIAPSPTGYFHVGTARTALFNWLFARQTGGTFVLRIEDTDTARNRVEHVEGIQRAMQWLGFDWDEGPYFQSERRGLYDRAIESLWAAGRLYACACSAQDVQSRKVKGDPPGYDGYCRDKGLAPEPGLLLRFRTPDEEFTVFDDLVEGKKEFPNATIEDFGVRKSNGDPLFILANVVDDAEMAITHVIRGNDHTSNTPKYVLLWEALGYGSIPVFAHLPLLFNEKRQKLSKRRDKVAVEDYRDEGYLPEAMRNYLGLLGWSPKGDREIVTIEEMTGEFRLEDVKSAPAIFDEKKLQAINAVYLRALPTAELVERSQAWLQARWEPIAGQVQERARTLGEVFAMTDFLYLPAPCFDQAAWDKATRTDAAATMLRAAAARYAGIEWSATEIEAATRAAAEEAGIPQMSKAQAPIRLAITGRTVGPPLWESMALLGQDRSRARLAAALTRLDGSA